MATPDGRLTSCDRRSLLARSADFQRGTVTGDSDQGPSVGLVFWPFGMSNGSTVRRAALAYCCERAGEIDESLALLDAALETADATNERYYEAELYRLKGEWLLAHRPARGAEAESCYQHALAIARRQQARFWELRAATSLARLEGDQGKRTEARDLLGPVYGWFTEGFDTPFLQDAKALLDELG
jgi:predicted ATPase